MIPPCHRVPGTQCKGAETVWQDYRNFFLINCLTFVTIQWNLPLESKGTV